MMRITKLTTYWSAEEANAVCEFLEALRDALLDEYRDKIVVMHRAIQEDAQKSAAQYPLPFDDADPF